MLIDTKKEPDTRQGGQLKGLIKISEDFDAPLPEELLEFFYNEPKPK